MKKITIKKPTTSVPNVKNTDKASLQKQINDAMNDTEEHIDIKKGKWIKETDEISILTDIEHDIKYVIDKKLIDDMKTYVELRKKHPDIYPVKKTTIDNIIKMYIIYDDNNNSITATSASSVMTAVKNALYGYHNNEKTNKLLKFDNIEGLRVELIGYIKGASPIKVTNEIKDKIFNAYIERKESDLVKIPKKIKEKKPKLKVGSGKEELEKRIIKLEKKMECIAKYVTEHLNISLEEIFSEIDNEYAAECSEDIDSQKVSNNKPKNKISNNKSSAIKYDLEEIDELLEEMDN